MPNESPWEFAREILSRRFTGVRNPIFFNDPPTVDEQIHTRGKPYPYLMATIELLQKMNGRMIVEIGSMRHPMLHPIHHFDPGCCTEGHSTVFWGHSGLSVHSVDIDPRCSEVAAQACKGLPNVHIHCGDGIQFLKDFKEPIDLLYLDAWDVVDSLPYSEKHLEAYEVAKDKLSPSAIILIDDTDMNFGGKGRQAVPAIIRDGFDLLVAARQTLLLRLR